MQFLGGPAHALTAAKGAEAHLAALRQVAAIVRHRALALGHNDVLLLMAGTFFIALALLPAKPNTGAAVAH
jgi:hypothetical protein